MTGALLTDQALDQLFARAHTANGWENRPVSEEMLRRVYDIMKFGPTSANSSPLRIVFVQSPEAKARLKPCLDPGNVEKTMAAPVTAIFGMDTKFYEHMGFLFPHTNARPWFEGRADLPETFLRNSSLQAAYFMIAARACGLDCGPMSGFDKEKTDKEFFRDGRYKSNFLCNLGYADHAKDRPRGPRFKFEDVCQMA
jgi:3-hydroxypropanoate dehydrogenase